MSKKANKGVGYRHLAVDTAYFGSGLNATEIIIMSKVDEFLRNTGECYATNEQFAEWCGASKDTVKRTMNKLEDKGYIKRRTEVCSDNGKASKKRTILHGDTWYQSILPRRIIDE